MGRFPNVVLVLTDDQGYGDLGCTGNPVIKTPEIDRFAAESVRFTDFHGGPTCAPSRAGLLTGHFANSTGVWHTIGGRSLLRKDEWTLADVLRECGYATGIFGKWHLGDAPPFRPQDRGFDVTVVHGGGGIGQVPDHWGNDYFDDVYMVNGQSRRFQGYCTDVFFREAFRFIEANRQRPFFCYLATNAPHTPYNVESRYADPYRPSVPERRARFYGMIANLDENFGLLRRQLRRAGVERDTILAFMTDNGTSCGAVTDERGFVTDGYNAGMRGIKGSAYEGGHRVPFFLRWPGGSIDGGREIDCLAAHVDFMPTILDLCGVRVPADRSFDGLTLAPLIRDEASGAADRTLTTDSQRLTRPRKWKQSCTMLGKWRLIDGKELYDVSRDPEERIDLAGSRPDLVTAMRRAYEEWWDKVSVRFDEEIPAEVGPETGPVVLTCHDWKGLEEAEICAPWNQGMIRKGVPMKGYWETRILASGRYRISLRRWPFETDHAIVAGITGEDVEWRKAEVLPGMESWYQGGEPIDAVEAVLIAEESEGSVSTVSAFFGTEGDSSRPDGPPGRAVLRVPVKPEDRASDFLVDLRRGHYRLAGIFVGADGSAIGSYYARVEAS